MKQITDAQIEALKQGAANAGDDATVRDCRKALEGGKAARERVEAIIRDTQAEAEYQEDGESA